MNLECISPGWTRRISFNASLAFTELERRSMMSSNKVKHCKRLRVYIPLCSLGAIYYEHSSLHFTALLWIFELQKGLWSVLFLTLFCPTLCHRHLIHKQCNFTAIAENSTIIWINYSCKDLRSSIATLTHCKGSGLQSGWEPPGRCKQMTAPRGWFPSWGHGWDIASGC